MLIRVESRSIRRVSPAPRPNESTIIIYIPCRWYLDDTIGGDGRVIDPGFPLPSTVFIQQLEVYRLSDKSTSAVPGSFFHVTEFILSAGIVVIQPSTWNVVVVRDG